MPPDEKTNTTISCIMHAIEDTQATIRAFDTKAEILGVFLTLAIGITNFALLEHTTGVTKCLLASSWIMALITIAALGLVLHPKKNPFKNIALGNYTPSSTYFLFNLLSSPQNTITALADKAINTDWVSELMYENMKLSAIRDHKHFWFTWALKLAGITILLIAISISVGIR